MLSRAIILFIALYSIAITPAAAQEPEIYIPGRDQKAFPKAKPENYLAKCLANPGDRIACYIARTATSDGGLESAVRGQLKPSTYVTCTAPGGVCLEVATYDPDEPAQPAPASSKSAPKSVRPSAPPQARLPSIDITILFDLDKAAIRASEQSKLNQLAAALKHLHAQGIRFAIIGHTDATGSASHNCKLSTRRARAVATHLTALGIAADRLKPIGAGEAVLRNAADPAAAENRRVGLARLGGSVGKSQIVDRLVNLCQVEVKRRR